MKMRFFETLSGDIINFDKVLCVYWRYGTYKSTENDLFTYIEIQDKSEIEYDFFDIKNDVTVEEINILLQSAILFILSQEDDILITYKNLENHIYYELDNTRSPLK